MNPRGGVVHDLYIAAKPRSTISDDLIMLSSRPERHEAVIPAIICSAEWRDPENLSSAMQIQGVLPTLLASAPRNPQNPCHLDRSGTPSHSPPHQTPSRIPESAAAADGVVRDLLRCSSAVAKKNRLGSLI